MVYDVSPSFLFLFFNSVICRAEAFDFDSFQLMNFFFSESFFWYIIQENLA